MGQAPPACPPGVAGVREAAQVMTCRERTWAIHIIEVVIATTEQIFEAEGVGTQQADVAAVIDVAGPGAEVDLISVIWILDLQIGQRNDVGDIEAGR